MTVLTPTSLLSTPFAALATLSPYLSATTYMEGDGWRSAQELLGSPDLLEQYFAGVGAALGTDDAKVIASFFVAGYMWSVAVGIAGAYLQSGRVPLAPLDSVYLHFDAGNFPDNVAFTAPHVTVCGTDNDADHPFAMVVADETALQNALRTSLESQCAAIITAIRPYTTLNTNTLWRIVTDRCASVILYVCELLGTPERAAAEIAMLVGDPSSRFALTTSAVCYTIQAQPRWMLRRSSCCFNYKLPNSGYCVNCPLISDMERIARLEARH